MASPRKSSQVSPPFSVNHQIPPYILGKTNSPFEGVVRLHHFVRFLRESIRKRSLNRAPGRRKD
jgi:hypothetical protein